MKRSFLLCITLSVLTAACSKGSSPTSPTPAAATRSIRLGGDLNFGEVTINRDPKDGVLTVSNDGNGVLQIDRMSGPCIGRGFGPLSPTAFSVAPGETLSVGFRFAPTIPSNCSGEIIVFGNQTSGTNTIAVTARGVAPRCHAVPGGVICE
jgi:hypothetical protein